MDHGLPIPGAVPVVRRKEDAAVRVKGSDHANLPKPPVATDEVDASPPAVLALARLLGRLAAIEEQQAVSEQRTES
jgi:hypothetical protein